MEQSIQIKIEKSQGGKSVVSARELHSQLQVKTQFKDWFPRMCEYGFVENQDYCSILSSGNNQQLTKEQIAQGGTNKKDYAITLDMAKELCMIQRTEIGKRFRNYFIECEKKLMSSGGYAIPQTYAQALALAAKQAEQIEQQQKQLELQAPKVDFYDKVTLSKDTVDMNEAAKLLRIPNVGRNTLFALLREKKVLDSKNRPYQKYVEQGYFKLVETQYYKNGEIRVGLKPVVFQKGLDYIRKLFRDFFREGNKVQQLEFDLEY